MSTKNVLLFILAYAFGIAMTIILIKDLRELLKQKNNMFGLVGRGL